MSADSATDAAHLVPVAAKLRRSRRLWRVLAFLALAGAALALYARFGLEDTGTGDRIARVELYGAVTTDPARVNALRRIAEDERVKGVIIAINSPGGSTAGGEEIYEMLSSVRASKPVVAVVQELGASAAYMAALGTDRIVSRRLSIVGSIGVMYQHVNAGKLFETIGVDFDKVATGPLKSEPDNDEPLTGAPRASLQALVDDSFSWFVDIVAQRRGITKPEALMLSDGRIVAGWRALEHGLIDGIGGEAEAIGWLETERGLAEDLPVLTYYPLPQDGFAGLWQFLTGQARSALGFAPNGPITLDGLVSLWQG